MPIEQFIIFFLLLITGFFCKKYGVLTDAAVNAVNKFIIIVGYPSLILARITALDMDHGIFINFLLALFINIGLLLAFGAYARVYCRGERFPDEDKPVVEFAIMSPNNGFMGFPVALAFFGDLGLLYMIGANVALNTVFFTYGVKLLNRGREVPKEPAPKRIKKLLLMFAHPKLSAAFVGIILCYNYIKLPDAAMGFLNTVGSIAPPLAMIAIGTMLAGGFGLHSFRKRIVMEPVINNLIVMPVIAAAIIWFLPLDPLLKTIIIVSSTMPVATMVPIFSEQYGRNKGLAGEIIVIATLFSMVTIPFTIWIISNSALHLM